MDEVTLRALRAAFDASPDNTALLAVLLRAHLERGEHEEGLALLGERTEEDFASPEDRRVVAELCLKGGDPARALFFASGEQPELCLLRARALLALERKAEGLEAYHKAVDQSPALEDLDLKAALGARVYEPKEPAGDGAAGNVTRLKVISTDDTDDSELGRLLHPETRPVSFKDVGGLEEVKRQIEKRIILPFQKPSLFERFKKKVGGGILLYGPPGCGKTLLARATAGECNAAFFNVAISDVLDMYIGESERKLAALFEKARQSAPAVLFFDELEALAGKRQYTREGTSSKLVSQFLSEMDGFAKNNQGVLILGATNVPWSIDPAFRRPGRFDRVVFVPPPDKEARASILEILLAERPTTDDIDVGSLAAKTSGFSGADLENVVETAADAAIEASIDTGAEVPIGTPHLLGALREVKPTTLEWLTTARNYARYANEAGQYDDVLEFLRKHGRS